MSGQLSGASRTDSYTHPGAVHVGDSHYSGKKWFTFLQLTYAMRFLGFVASIAIAVILCFGMHEVAQNLKGISQPDYFTLFLALLFHFFTALMLLAIMFEWQWVMKRVPLFNNWPFLGILQMYLAVLVVSSVTCPGRFSDEVTYGIRISSLVLFIVGVLFFVLGLAGGKAMKEQREKTAAIRRDLERA